MATWLKPAEIQQKLGMSKENFHALKKKGYFVVVEGMIDFEEAEKTYNLIRRNKPQSEDTLEAGKEAINYNKIKAVKTAYEAKLKKLEFDEINGTLINVEQAQKAVFDAVRRTRNSFLAFPDRLAAVLALETDKAKIHDILSKEVRIILEDLVITFKK